ncbi:uncharacterized protein LOC143840425 [Paroedura picta]|uniref:uncharacterized protein LOC143840425 n=1 Tax=Paroedura picta TaxID=143630 RepID=UPI004055ED53
MEYSELCTILQTKLTFLLEQKEMIEPISMRNSAARTQSENTQGYAPMLTFLGGPSSSSLEEPHSTIGNHCNCLNTSWIWILQDVFVRTLASAFCISWSFQIKDKGDRRIEKKGEGHQVPRPTN